MKYCQPRESTEVGAVPTHLWRQLDARDPAKGYGTFVAGTWFWYERWVNVVREHCREHSDFYS